MPQSWAVHLVREPEGQKRLDRRRDGGPPVRVHVSWKRGPALGWARAAGLLGRHVPRDESPAHHELFPLGTCDGRWGGCFLQASEQPDSRGAHHRTASRR